MDKKICSNCGQENEKDYTFCKNCGAHLPDADEQPSGAEYTPHPNFAGGNYYSPFINYAEVTPEIDGVEIGKIEAYVGEKKRDRFMQNFISAAKMGRSAFFNWAVAILGTLLSATFASAWFFYRKCYKAGIIICCAVLALSVLTVAVNFNNNKEEAQKAYQSIENLSEEEIYGLIINNETTNESSNKAFNISKFTNASNLITKGIALLEFAGVIIIAVFAFKIYYNNTLNNIRRYDVLHPNAQKYEYAILGRPNLAAAILIPIGFNALINLISLAPYFSLVLSGADILKVLYAIIYF